MLFKMGSLEELVIASDPTEPEPHKLMKIRRLKRPEISFMDGEDQGCKDIVLWSFEEWKSKYLDWELLFGKMKFVSGRRYLTASKPRKRVVKPAAN